jgi:hydrogenase/urease accessory protein HupE
MGSVSQLKVYLSWKSRSSVGVPQLEVSVLISGIALGVILAIDMASLWSFY